MRLVGMLRAVMRMLVTQRIRVSIFEKVVRGIILVPVFGVTLVILRLRAAILGPLRVEAETEHAGRFTCHLPDLIQMYLYLFGVWEPDLAAYLRSRLGDGDVFVDVGANVGYDTLLASRRVGESGRVVAIEASPTVFDRLLETLRLNGAPSNVRTINKAASETAGTLEIYAGPSHNLGLTTTVRRGAMPRVASIEALPLGDLLHGDELARVRLIKIDVEGGEDAVLAGLVGCVDRLPRDAEIAVELSPMWWRDQQKSAADVLQAFIDRGFHVFTIPNNYWPWRYLWPNVVCRPRRLRDISVLTLRVKRLDVVLARQDADAL
jgi:FkbM family methyltransferase